MGKGKGGEMTQQPMLKKTPAELAHLGRKLAQIMASIDDLKDEAKARAKEYREEIQELHATACGIRAEILGMERRAKTRAKLGDHVLETGTGDIPDGVAVLLADGDRSNLSGAMARQRAAHGKMLIEQTKAAVEEIEKGRAKAGIGKASPPTPPKVPREDKG